MLRKRSGPMTSTTCPAASAPRMVLRSVITTPLTCGSQASVASRMRNRPPLLQRGYDGRRGQVFDLFPVQDGKLPLGVFHQRGQALDPIAIVAVENATDRAHFGLVDMAADHAVD